MVVISWVALAPMSAPIWVELWPTWAATAENGRLCSGTKEYWAEGSTTFPPKSMKGNEPPFVLCHKVCCAGVGVWSGA